MAGKCAGCADGAELPFAFKMAFQPIVDVTHERIWGYEALVRGPQGEGAYSVLSQLTEDQLYRFDQAARVMAIETAGKLFNDPSTRLSINFMPNAVYEPRACIQKSLEAARRANFPSQNLMFELTENERMNEPAHVENIVAAYKKLGFLTALDDFGAGYAGLNLLARLQPDLIKIDMELLRDIHRSPSRQVIVSGVASIAHQLGITVLAEGVESEAELTLLRGAGITLFQGYYFARPALMALPLSNKLGHENKLGHQARGRLRPATAKLAGVLTAKGSLSTLDIPDQAALMVHSCNSPELMHPRPPRRPVN